MSDARHKDKRQKEKDKSGRKGKRQKKKGADKNNLLHQMRGFVYMMTNGNNTVLYTGVTSNLKGRVKEHKEKLHPGSFTARYNIRKLVYFESFDSIVRAIIREKQIKAGPREKKLELINGNNPEWQDLTIDLDA